MSTRKQLMEQRSELENQYKALVNDKENFNAEKAEELYNGLEKIDSQLQHMNKADKFKSADAGESKSIAKEVGNIKDVMASILSNKPNEALFNLSQDARREGEANGVSYQNERSIVLSNKQMDAIFNATLTTGTAADGGGNALETIEMGYIDKLRDRLVVESLGADFMTDLVGNIDFTAEKNVAVAAWDAETDTISDTSATFEKRQLTPKRLTVYLPISNQWLKQSSTNYASMIERQLVRAVAEKIEAAAIAGTGASDQPTGILSASGVTELFAGAAAADNTNANGAALVHGDVIALEKAIAVNNADVNGLAYLTNAKVRAALKTTAVESGDAQRVWMRGSNELEGYNVGITNLVPSNLAKGAGTDLSAIIFGNFRDLLIGQWGGIELLVDPYTSALAGTTRMIINHYVDVLVRRPESFAFIDDAVA